MNILIFINRPLNITYIWIELIMLTLWSNNHSLHISLTMPTIFVLINSLIIYYCFLWWSVEGFNTWLLTCIPYVNSPSKDMDTVVDT